MEIQVNGELRALPPETCLENLIAELKVGNQAIAVAVNRNVISRSQWQQFVLQAGDVVANHVGPAFHLADLSLVFSIDVGALTAVTLVEKSQVGLGLFLAAVDAFVIGMRVVAVDGQSRADGEDGDERRRRIARAHGIFCGGSVVPRRVAALRVEIGAHAFEITEG